MDKRELILEATAELIAHNGLQSSPVSLVASQACCGAGTIYRYFETKEALVEEVYLRLIQRITQACLANDDPQAEVHTRLTKIWLNLYHYMLDNQQDSALMEQLSATPAIRQSLREQALEEIHAVLFQLLDRGKENGIIKSLPNRVLAMFAYGGIATLVRKDDTLLNDEITDEMVAQLCWDSVSQCNGKT